MDYLSFIFLLDGVSAQRPIVSSNPLQTNHPAAGQVLRHAATQQGVATNSRLKGSPDNKALGLRGRATVVQVRVLIWDAEKRGKV